MMFLTVLKIIHAGRLVLEIPTCEFYTSATLWSKYVCSLSEMPYVEYRNQIQHYFYVKNSRILAPYLTVEFKRNKTSSRKGINQVAAAGSLAFYNRFFLRKDAIGNNSWNAADLLENVRHYGLTMEGLDFKFWVLEPRSENGQWTGADMRWLDVEAFREDDNGFGFNTFIKWLNEIHRWGLAFHGPSVEKDIKRYIENDQNSNIFPSQHRGLLIEEIEED